MALIRVGILRGGVSKEYEMSLRVGQHILNLLAKEPLSKKYKGVDVLIDRTGEWHIDGIPQSPEVALRKVDVVFSTLRGEFGEDGKLQQMLDQFSKPFVGSKAYSSALTQNKALAKNHFKQNGIKTPYFKELHLEHGENVDPLAHDLFRSFPMPVVVKPKGHGSSLGVSFASNVKELIDALKHAQGYSNEIVVEEYLTGKEIISGFIEDFRGSDLYHMFPVEIKPHVNNLTYTSSDQIGDLQNDVQTEAGAPKQQSEIAEDFASVNTTVEDLSPAEKELISAGQTVTPKPKHAIFDWAAKYSGAYDHKAPANLTEQEKNTIKQAMETVQRAFGLRHFATADFIVHPRRGVYLLEINAHPHLHEHSPIFKSLDASGIKHHEFLEHLLRLALEDGK